MRLESSITIAEKYDDNVFFREVDREGDFITTLSPNLRVGYDWPLVGIAVNYRGSLRLYEMRSRLNHYNQNGALDINLDRLVNRFTKRAGFKLTETIILIPDLPDFALDPRSDGGTASDGGLLGRSRAFQNLFGIHFSYQVTRRSLVTTDYSNTITEYSDSRLSDHIAQSVQGGFSYQLSPTNTLLQNIRYQNILFDGSLSTDTYLGTIGWKHSFTPDFTFQINGGVFYIPDLETRKGRFFFSGNIDKAIAPERDVQVSLHYVRDVRASGLTNRVVSSQNAGVTVSKRFTQLLTGSIRGDYATSRSIGGRLVDLESFTAGADLNYLINAWLSSGLSYSFFRRNSRGALGEDVDRNQVLINLTATLPVYRGI